MAEIGTGNQQPNSRGLQLEKIVALNSHLFERRAAATPLDAHFHRRVCILAARRKDRRG